VSGRQTAAQGSIDAEASMFDALVLGGGIAGITCAVGLADAGMKVALLERERMLGGRARSWRDPTTGDMVDIGPHVVHSEYRNMLALLDRFGTRAQIAWQPRELITLATRPRPTVIRHWPLPPPFGLLPSLLTAPDLSLRDLVSTFGVFWRGMTFGEEQVAALDRMPAREFLRMQGVTPQMIDWMWAFASMALFNVPLERCSAAALLRVHAAISSVRRLHFGFPAVGLAELFAAQATRAIESAGGRVFLGAEVRALRGEERFEAALLSDGAPIGARFCVSALPPQDLLSILPPAWHQRRPFDQLACFEPSPYISCYLWFDRDIGSKRFWAHLWSPARLNYDFYELSKIRSGWAGRPSVIASNIVYSHRAGYLSDEAIVQGTQREIAEFIPAAATARIEHAAVHRIPMAITCPTPGMEALRPETVSPVADLLLCGDWTRTQLPSCMESAARSGWMAAEAVLHGCGRSQRLAHDPPPAEGVAGLVRRTSMRVRSRRGPSRTG